MRRLFGPLPLLVAGAMLAVTVGEPLGVALFCVPIGAAWLRRGQIALSTPGQVILGVACAVSAFVFVTLVPAGSGTAALALRPGFAQLAYGALLFAGLRLHLLRPAFGLSGTLGAGLLVFLAVGSVRVGESYPALLIAYAGFSFLALRIEDVAERGRSQALGRGGSVIAASVWVLGLTVGLTLGFAVAIPRAHELVYDWALGWIDQPRRIGFHDGPLRLGSLGELLSSDQIVMRVAGDAGDHLRGNVYTRYAQGRWLPEPHGSERDVRTAAADSGARPDRTIRAVIRYADTDADRYFLPSVPGGLRLSPAGVRVDKMGGVRTDGVDGVRRIVLLWAAEQPFQVAPPDATDLLVPEGVRAVVTALAREWAPMQWSADLRISSIQARLETDYTYSLEGRTQRVATDPLVSFLVEDRAGHCEYFASAMTLLARAAGVPARLVTGYRIAESNPFGGYKVVRERHAHAWTEVFLDSRGWVIVDPSPLLGTAPAEVEVTPWLPGLVDYGMEAWRRHGPETLLVGLVIGLVAVQLWRILRGRSPRPGLAPSGVEPPPVWMTALLDRLAASGLERAASEPLESLARRARAAGGSAESSDFGEAALLLRRYAAMRYGGQGEFESVRDDFVRWSTRAGNAASVTDASL